MAGKVACEKGFVDRHVFYPHNAFLVLELDNAVYEEEGVAVWHELLDEIDVPRALRGGRCSPFLGFAHRNWSEDRTLQCHW